MQTPVRNDDQPHACVQEFDKQLVAVLGDIFVCRWESLAEFVTEPAHTLGHPGARLLDDPLCEAHMPQPPVATFGPAMFGSEGRPAWVKFLNNCLRLGIDEIERIKMTDITFDGRNATCGRSGLKCVTERIKMTPNGMCATMRESHAAAHAEERSRWVLVCKGLTPCARRGRWLVQKFGAEVSSAQGVLIQTGEIIELLMT